MSKLPLVGLIRLVDSVFVCTCCLFTDIIIIFLRCSCIYIPVSFAFGFLNVNGIWIAKLKLNYSSDIRVVFTMIWSSS